MKLPIMSPTRPLNMGLLTEADKIIKGLTTCQYKFELRMAAWIVITFVVNRSYLQGRSPEPIYCHLECQSQ